MPLILERLVVLAGWADARASRVASLKTTNAGFPKARDRARRQALSASRARSIRAEGSSGVGSWRAERTGDDVVVIAGSARTGGRDASHASDSSAMNGDGGSP